MATSMAPPTRRRTIELELTTVAPPPPGPPETFYVRTGGTGTDCTEADPCGTIADALAAHRITSGPGNVIDVGPGDFPENVEAGDDFDGGLTIRGTLDGNGDHLTSITGSGGGGASCPYACAVLLGASDDVAVTLQDVAVSTATADGYVGPIMMGGGSDLEGVHATAQSGAFLTSIVEFMDEEPGTVISESTIDARDTFAVGLWGGNGVDGPRLAGLQRLPDGPAVQLRLCGGTRADDRPQPLRHRGRHPAGDEHRRGAHARLRVGHRRDRDLRPGVFRRALGDQQLDDRRRRAGSGGRGRVLAVDRQLRRLHGDHRRRRQLDPGRADRGVGRRHGYRHLRLQRSAGERHRVVLDRRLPARLQRQHHHRPRRPLRGRGRRRLEPGGGLAGHRQRPARAIPAGFSGRTSTATRVASQAPRPAARTACATRVRTR